MATIEKRIIYKNIESVATPTDGSIIFRLNGRPMVKLSKDSFGNVSEIKPTISMQSEVKRFRSEYSDIQAMQMVIKKGGVLKILELIFGGCTSEDQSNRLVNALDKGVSFYVALQTNNFILAKSRLDVFLSDGLINLEDKELILFYVELAENID